MQSRGLFTAVAAAFAVAALAAGGGTARADSGIPPVVPSLQPAETDALWEQLVRHPVQASASEVASCRPMRVVLYTETDWLRLTTKLAANPSSCAQYYISIPPLAADKTQLRSDQAWRIRALGPHFHAAAEINVTGWTTWVANNGGSWYAAGVEARNRMAAAGFDVSQGDIWALNELSSAVRQGAGSARANMDDLVRGLHDGAFGPAVRGTVFTSGISQPTADVSTYQARLQDWLEDATFWADMSSDVADWSQEVYGDFRNYGVAGSSLAQRRDALDDFLQHVQRVANAGPSDVSTARTFLQTAYSPLANAAWQWETGFGWTHVPFDQMEDYVSAQTYALRYASASAAQDHGGFAWSPRNLDGLSTSDFNTQSAAILDRLAAAIHDSGQPVDPSDPGVGACHPPGGGTWCTASIGGAAFNTAWQSFATWRPSLLTFTSAPQSLVAGAASSPITFQLQTSTGVPLTATTPLQVTLTTNSGKGRFGTTSTGPWNGSLSVTIPAGSSTSPASYYLDKKAGTPVLTASAPGKQSGTQPESVAPGPVVKIKLSPTSATVAPGGHQPFSAKALDAYGNAVDSSGASWSVPVGTPGSVSPATGAATTFTAGSTPGSGSVVATLGSVTASAPVTVAGAVSVASITYALQGQDVLVTFSAVDGGEAPVGHAALSFTVTKNGASFTTGGATTGSGGHVIYRLTIPGSGCYSTTVTAVTKTGYAWDGKTPANQFCF